MVGQCGGIRSNMDWQSEFDPYEELLLAKHNINELVKGLNHQSHLFRDLANQHQQLIDLHRSLQIKVQQLEQEVKSLKNT